MDSWRRGHFIIKRVRLAIIGIGHEFYGDQARCGAHRQLFVIHPTPTSRRQEGALRACFVENLERPAENQPPAPSPAAPKYSPVAVDAPAPASFAAVVAAPAPAREHKSS